MPQEIMRQWFIPGEAIDRHVISTDIQRYLGNDATVRPGVGTGEHQVSLRCFRAGLLTCLPRLRAYKDTGSRPTET